MYSVMDELSSKWGDLSEVQRAAISEAIGGKQQANAFGALMNNFDTARELMSDFNDGLTVGSAAKERIFIKLSVC